MDYQSQQFSPHNTGVTTNHTYHELVNMLLQNITPEFRSMVLNKLVTYNNQLIKSQSYDPARPSALNSRRKDVNELQHPSMYSNTRSNNPTPLTLPIRGNNFTVNQVTPTYIPEPRAPEIDIDDIIDDFSEPESLESKLRKIDALHKKIITDKKQRRKKLS